jgi:hypothetical protein
MKAPMVIIGFRMCLELPKGITPIGNEIYTIDLDMRYEFNGMISTFIVQ